MGTGGHYSRAPCTLKFGFAKERLRAGLGGQQASQRAAPQCKTPGEPGVQGVARGAPVEGGPVPWHCLPISGRRARSGSGQRPEHQVARRGYRAWCNSIGGMLLVIPI
ncbi:protein of unknown function [Cupriavidus taiwanensis]|nr:protein of unknown function [Cupriavidus taiwanensis]